MKAHEVKEFEMTKWQTEDRKLKYKNNTKKKEGKCWPSI